MQLGGSEAGQTPLEPDEASQLIPTWVTTRADLDSAEQENIASATTWALHRRLAAEDTLDEGFVRELHRRMFNDVWRWAGSFRTTARDIGVDAWRIVEEIATLLGDTRYWVEHQTYSADEIAVRFHHRLVSIHAFPNGNGRHARLATDLLLISLGVTAFTWGIDRAIDPLELRKEYIDAIHCADAGEIGPLLAFARS